MSGYPFSAVVGLDDLKLALLLNAVHPGIGGVLVRGEKGSAKSTVVRGLADLLPDVCVVSGCRFACDPDRPDPACPDGPHPAGGAATRRPARLVELPVGASEDRLTGSLDVSRALREGVAAFEPGLLAAAHRGLLYVDEVNLLPDHLVDALLDAAAMGVNHVEREGVSVRHAARFLLVGTMNPEEGELRPQLLDRFGLTVTVRSSRDAGERAEVVRRRLAFEADPAAFAAQWAGAEAELATRIEAARDRLPGVRLPDEALHQVAAVCAAFDVDGMRADLVTARTAVALAAWDGRDEVGEADVTTAARLALPHRRRRDPFDSPDLDEQTLSAALGEPGERPTGPDDGEPGARGGPDGGDPARGPDGGDPAPARGPDRDPDPDPDRDPNRDPDRGPDGGGGGGAPPGGPGETNRPADAVGATFPVRRLEVPGTAKAAPGGRRGQTLGALGRTVGARRPSGEAVRRVHLPATITAAALHRDEPSAPGRAVRPEHLREPVLVGRESNLVLFCLDASGSMGARARMGAVKGAVLSLLLDAYQRRDRVGLVTFRGTEATLALPPTSSVELAGRRLAALATGGRTPLAAGLDRAADLIAAERRRDPGRRPLLVVVTDGRRTSGPDPAHAAARLRGRGVTSVVVDCEDGPVRLGLAGELASALGGPCVRLPELSAAPLAGLVRTARGAA